MKYTLINRVLFTQKKKRKREVNRVLKITRQYYADQKKIYGDN